MASSSHADFVHRMVKRSQRLTSGDGEQVVLHDLGGAGPPLLLGHGNGLNTGMWVPAVLSLRAKFRCFGVDLRGHGVCRVVQSDYSVERDRLGEDLMACVDTIGEPVAYAGHSLGGAAAIYGSLARPSLFSAMWLFEPVVIGDWVDRSSPPSALVEMTRRRRSEFESVDDAVQRFMAKPPFNQCDVAAVRAYVEFGTRPSGADRPSIELTCRPDDEARVFGSGQPMDFGRLGAITTPTVIAAGANVEDLHAIPAQMAAPLAEAMPNARLELHHSLGHFGPMEAPEVVAGAITTHIEQCVGDG